MGVLQFLQGLGSRLKLVQAVETAGPGAPPKIETRTVTLKELMSQVQAEPLKELAEKPAELTVPFEKIYETAGVKPAAGGWGVEKIAQLLQSDQYRAMDRLGVQRAILYQLKNDKVEIEAVVKDAIARDQALDAYDGFVQEKLKARSAARAEKIHEISGQIERLQSEIACLREQESQDRQHRQEWLTAKVALEKEMAQALNYFVERPVVSVTPME